MHDLYKTFRVFRGWIWNIFSIFFTGAYQIHWPPCIYYLANLTTMFPKMIKTKLDLNASALGVGGRGKDSLQKHEDSGKKWHAVMKHLTL